MHTPDVLADKLLGLLRYNKFLKIKKIPITGLATGAETDTGFVLPDDAVVMDIFLKVVTPVSGKTIDIGTDGTGSNDPNGFASALSVATAGIVRPQGVVSTGSSETYYSANTRGELLSDYLAGTDAASDFGIYREKPDVSSGGDKVTYTPESATAALVAELYIVYFNLSDSPEM